MVLNSFSSLLWSFYLQPIVEESAPESTLALPPSTTADDQIDIVGDNEAEEDGNLFANQYCYIVRYWPLSSLSNPPFNIIEAMKRRAFQATDLAIKKHVQNARAFDEEVNKLRQLSGDTQTIPGILPLYP